MYGCSTWHVVVFHIIRQLIKRKLSYGIRLYKMNGWTSLSSQRGPHATVLTQSAIHYHNILLVHTWRGWFCIVTSLHVKYRFLENTKYHKLCQELLFQLWACFYSFVCSFHLAFKYWHKIKHSINYFWQFVKIWSCRLRSFSALKVLPRMRPCTSMYLMFYNYQCIVVGILVYLLCGESVFRLKIFLLML